jgi:acyl carrier protein
MNAPQGKPLSPAPERLSPAEGDVIAIISALVSELQSRPGQTLAISSASRLDRDLGIDSLSRAELILRLQEAFRIRLADNVISDVETVGDLVAAVARSAPRSAPALDTASRLKRFLL